MPRAGVPGLHPKPCHGPRNGSPRRESCSVVRYPFCLRMCGKRRCSRRNMRQMLTCPGRGEGFVPGFRVRVMGCARGRGRGENGYRITLWSAGALPGKILHELPGMCCIIPARIRETVRRFSVLQSQPGRIRTPEKGNLCPPVFRTRKRPPHARRTSGPQSGALAWTGFAWPCR